MQARSFIAIISILFVVTFAVFFLSPVRQMTDSRYLLLVSQSLLEFHRFDLDGYRISRGGVRYSQEMDEGEAHAQFHQLTVAGDHVYYNYPPGSSILSVPFVALMNAVEVYPIHRNSVYLEANESRRQALLASFLMALLTCVFFATARLILPAGWSLLIAAGGAFGTQVWSTASRAMWSHTWGILLLGVVLLLLVLHESRKRDLNPIVAATLLSWMFFVRPTCIASILAVTGYIALCYRGSLMKFLLTGAFWAGILGIYFYTVFGSFIPSRYDPGEVEAGDFWLRMAFHLISPSRGLIVFLPVLLFVAYVVVRYFRYFRFRKLVIASSAAMMAHMVIVCMTIATGGHCYGPRHTTDLVAWFVLMGILSVDALLTYRSEHKGELWRLRFEATAGILLLALSVLLNSRGALSPATARWNSESRDKNVREWAVRRIKADRFWDWKRAQFLAGLNLFDTAEPDENR
jgi:hypothetical protein